MQRELSVFVAAGLAVLAAGLAANAATDRRAGPSAHARPVATAIVKVAFNKALERPILVDGTGRALYMWTADIGGKSACFPDPGCLGPWPPYLTTGKPVAGRGLTASLLDTTPDGKQVRYNRHPLYRFRGGRYQGVGNLGSGDKPGQVESQGLFDVWYVVSPRGVPIRTKPA